jgi:hypothetical protein
VLFFTDSRAYLYGYSYLEPRIRHPDISNVGRTQYSNKFLAENFSKMSDVYRTLRPSASYFGGPDFKSELEDRLP